MLTNYKLIQAQYYLDYFIEHCILAVAFFLPLSLNVSSVFLTMGTGLWIIKMIVLHRVDLKRTPLDGLIAILVILSALSIFASPDKGFSFYNYHHSMGRYILLYYLVINNVHSRLQLKRLVWGLLSSALIVALYGFYQYIFGVDISAFQWVDGEQFPDLKIRVFSTMQNPNLLAGFLVTIMAVAGGLGLKADYLPAKVVLLSIVVILGVCLIFTFSRGAWLSVLAIIGLYGLIYDRRMLWLLLILPVVMLVGHDAVLERLCSILNPTDTSSTLRLALWESTIAMIADKPFFGIGWGAYWLVYPEYDFFVQDAAVKIFHAHNMYLHIAAEIGIPGFITFMAIMWKHIKMAHCIYKKTSDYWTAGLMLGFLSAIFGLAVGGLTDHVLFSIQISMVLWLLNALIALVYLQQDK